MTMKLLIALTFILSGCASKGIDATLFLKEKDQELVNLKGDVCLESGQQIIKAPDGEYYRMIHFYSNCDVRVKRRMEEFELKLWGIKPPKMKQDLK